MGSTAGKIWKESKVLGEDDLIFVTIGTGEGQYGFPRLIKEMDRIAAKIDEKVVMQIGLTEYVPKNTEYFRFALRKDIEKLCQEARIIVCHDGAGSIMTAFQFNKPVVVVPRMSKSAERERNENDLAIELERRQVIKVIWDIRGLENTIKSVDEGGHYNMKNERDSLVLKLREHINCVGKSKKGSG